jgi:hypothetical protein
MLLSGHAMRRMHLRHHARPLSDGDIEGMGARRSALGALLIGPANAIALRHAAFRGAGGRERTLQIVETLAGAAVVALALVTRAPTLVTLVAVAIPLQLSMSLWASHAAHHVPERLGALCKRLAFLRSPVLLSFAYHDLHHRRPGVSCQDLARQEPRAARGGERDAILGGFGRAATRAIPRQCRAITSESWATTASTSS